MNCLTVSQLLAYYIERKLLAEKTQKNYEIVVRVLTRDVSNSISDINEQRLLEWRGDVLSRASATTFNNYLRHLRALFNYGVKRQVVAENPFTEISPAPQPRPMPKTNTDDQYRRTLGFVKNSGKFPPAWFWATLLEFMGSTGVRARQVIELTWGDIDFAHGVIHLRVEGSKTSREWEIPLPDHVGENLYKWYLSESGHGKYVIHNRQVFNVTRYNPRYAGNKMTVAQLNAFYRRLSDEMGFRIGSRKLRHTLATNLANSADTAEGNLFALRDLLGHTDIRTTQIYVQGDVERIRRMMNASGLKSTEKFTKVHRVDKKKKQD